MEGSTDDSQKDEREWVDRFERLDPRYAPEEWARLAKLLTERGYIVHDGGVGPGSAVPSPEKLQVLIGTSAPIQCRVAFGETAGLLSAFAPAHNDFGLLGAGMLEADGMSVRLSGAGALSALFGSQFARRVEFSWRDIADVESDGSWIHFACRTPGSAPRAVTIRLPDPASVEQLVAALPKDRTGKFRPQLAAQRDFEHRLIAQSKHTPMTLGLMTLNALVFLATLFAGAEWLWPVGSVQIAWGSNFGPYTTDGEWWRLLTSCFVHFGLLHLAFNLWALASFGPLAERLYGSVNYLLLYLFAGICGSLTSIAWRPDTNSAGASGAIFGILGALLAAQWRLRSTLPTSVLRPLRNSALIFTGYALLAGVLFRGVDVAAHLGGLTAGFLLGGVAARPVTGERSYTRSDLRHAVLMGPVVAALLACGLWGAQRAAASLAGEGLYWQMLHGFRAGEHAANSEFNTALTRAKASPSNQRALADALERDVVPFWREVSDRASAIRLEPTSPHLSSLRFLQTLSNGRAHAFEQFAEGIRKNDPKEIATAEQELARLDDLIDERRRAR